MHRAIKTVALAVVFADLWLPVLWTGSAGADCNKGQEVEERTWKA